MCFLPSYRKMHLGKCLETGDWVAIRKDLNKNPIEGINGSSAETEILRILNKYGIKRASDTQNPAPSIQDPAPSTSAPQHLSTSHPVSITLWGTGNPYREFLYVDDMAEACIYVMNNINFTDLKALSI